MTRCYVVRIVLSSCCRALAPGAVRILRRSELTPMSRSRAQTVSRLAGVTGRSTSELTVKAAYFIHLAVANNRDNTIEGKSDASARPVWILRGAQRDDLDRPVRRNPRTSVERVALAERVVIDGHVETLTTYDHLLPDAGQARNASAVFAIPADATCYVFPDATSTQRDIPYLPGDYLVAFGRWIEDDRAIAAGRAPGRAFSAQ